MILGLDTSRYEDNPDTAQTIDWNKAIQADVEFVIMKATEGTSYIDPVFNLHSHNLAGKLPRGSYHFWRSNMSAKVQALHYYQTAGQLELPPILDVENWYDDLPSGPTLQTKLFEMLNEVDRAYGRECILYTSPNILKYFLKIGPNSLLCKRKLWIAHYGVAKPDIYPFTNWTMWQYSDHGDAAKYGINEALGVDENFYNGSWEQFCQEFEIGLPAPVPAKRFELAIFSKAAYWQRPVGGPLVTPTFPIPKEGTKTQIMLASDMQNYLKSINDAKAYAKIVDPNWGPSQGLNENGILKLNPLVYPGRNVMSVYDMGDGWGELDTVSTIQPPTIDRYDNPHLFHKVYGSNSVWSWFELNVNVTVPIFSVDKQYVRMSWLRILNPLMPVHAKIIVPWLNVRAEPNPSSARMTWKIYGQYVDILEVKVGPGGLWGKIDGGWISIRYKDTNYTSWKI